MPRHAGSSVYGLTLHYEAREVPLETAGEAVGTAQRFVVAVERMLSA